MNDRNAKQSRFRRYFPTIVASSIIVLGLLAIAFGVLKIHHGAVAEEALATDSACVIGMTIDTKPTTADAVCHIIAGAIRQTRDSEFKVFQEGGIDHRFLVFAGSDGRIYDFDTNGNDDAFIYRAATASPNMPAKLLTVDGQPDYIATAEGTSGPFFDPIDPLSHGRTLLAIGVTGVAIGLGLIVAGVGRSRPTRSRSRPKTW